MKRTHRNALRAALLFLLATLLFMGCGHQDHPAMTEAAMKNEQIDGAVRAVLDAQVAAWNRGDIEGFMDGYARSDKTSFASGDRLTRGWQTVLDRYKQRYDTRDKMGTLAFSDLEVKALGENAALVTGHWQLTRAGDAPGGRFTLLFERTKDGWRITHDHTS